MRSAYHAGSLFAVFVIFVEDFQVTFVAGQRDVAAPHRLDDGAARFVRVRAVVEAASGCRAHHLGEVVPQFGVVDVDQPEALDAGRVDHRPAAGQRIHRREGRRVAPLVMALGDFARADVERRVDCPDERRLAHARVARDERAAPRQQLPDALHPRAIGRRDLQHLVTRPFVNGAERRNGLRVLQVDLREQDHDRDLVGLARHEEAVDELGRRLGLAQRHHEQRAVDVRRDDVRLLREVRRPADDIVAPRHDVHDDMVAVLILLAAHLVAHDHRIGRPHPLQAQAAPDAAAHRFAVAQDVVPAAGRTDHRSRKIPLHRSTVFRNRRRCVRFLFRVRSGGVRPRHQLLEARQLGQRDLRPGLPEAGQQPLRDPQHGPVALRAVDRPAPDERIVGIQRVEHREEYAQHQQVLGDRDDDAQHDVRDAEPGEMEELAQQPPEQRYGEDHDDEHRNEAARGGKTLLEVQQRADLGAVAGREPDAEHDARQRADLEDDAPPEAAPHGDEEYQADYQIDRIQKPIVSVCIREVTKRV